MSSGDLPAIAACWLSAHEGLRPEEINRLTVDDLRPDPTGGRHTLWVHSPRKGSHLVPIDEATLSILTELIRAGTDARVALKTNLLFATVEGPPQILRSNQLNQRIRQIFARHDGHRLPADYRLSDGRTTFGTHLARAIPDPDLVRRIMRHVSQQTTRQYYQGRLKLESEARIAQAIAPEVEKLYLAYQGEAPPEVIGAEALEQRLNPTGGVEARSQSLGVLIDSVLEHTVICTPAPPVRQRAPRGTRGSVDYV